ncbi:hypothetical protein P344_03265 [Spiroplasma mirum ATCC 29335]|uniref:Uncharacterized protein n=1 Tax=Spiroplasma mirum ATCC 29335 TaxID=838561 RepID=W6ALU0_9MOLU|nr:hypothetical protein P344_03265 [Spiroplasma mirum ATCC 29335]
MVFLNTNPQAKKLIGYIPESARFPKEGRWVLI